MKGKTKRMFGMLLLSVSVATYAQAQTPQITVVPSKNSRQADTIKSVPVKKQVRKRTQPVVPSIVRDTVALVVNDTVVIQDTIRLYHIDSVDAVKFQKLQHRTDEFQGLTKKIPYQRMIPPYGLEVTFDKTVHIIFPSPIIYVDLGNDMIIAGKAGSAENVLRVKSADEYFLGETNMSVITDNGSFYTFNVKFALEPEKLNIEMQDFIHDGNEVNRPNNSMDIFLSELNNETPTMVRMVMRSIYEQNGRHIKHIGSREFGIQYLLKGIYSYNGMLYFFTELKNTTNVPYNIDYLTMKIVDKKLVQRTTIQETVITPVRSYNFVTTVGAKSVELTVFAVPTFSIPQEKKLVFDLNEKQGGRTQYFEVDNADLVRAKAVTDFTILWK